ncbi:protein-disulfide reductase DsbD domain-containing protein [Roseovarius aestuariivivens]|uniref:protein-disulfide reductase DsbD domain-containing protein n=1 Tax=Roseovarius aestuariivivens TaxID=1888910 RepID=UPI00315A20BA
MTRILNLFAAMGLGLLAATGPAAAQSDLVEARILPGWRAADGTHIAGLQFTLKDGWKTYWRAPGDAGIPPQFDWRGSSNLSSVEIEWPTPRQIRQSGVTTIGYDRTVTLPLRISPARKGGAIRLSAQIDMGVCKDVCVPVNVSVAQNLGDTDAAPDPLIVAALAERPFSAAEAGVGRVTCRLSPIEDGLRLQAEIRMPSLGRGELAVFEAGDPNIWIAPSRTTRQNGRLMAETTLHHMAGRSFAVDRSEIRITVLGPGSAVDIQGCEAG